MKKKCKHCGRKILKGMSVWYHVDTEAWRCYDTFDTTYAEPK